MRGFTFRASFPALGKNGVLAGQIFQIPLENVPQKGSGLIIEVMTGGKRGVTAFQRLNGS